ncbi:MAG: hypothetical protein UHW86_09735, partial [Spirochaetota bacterium]|nr:hypothetical protein [Spirochaetota bacterium]
KATKLDGTFTDESNANVDDKISASFKNLIDNFKGNEIFIDTKAPTIGSYSIESISDEMHFDSGNYYLNAGDTVKIKVIFSEKVGVVGTSVLTLSSGENAVYLSNVDDKTLIYEYKVVAGTASPLSILENVYPTNIQDDAGNTLSAGLSKATLTYNEKNIVIDTAEPVAPTVSIGGESNASSFTQSVGMTIGGTEGNAMVEFSLDAGGNYETYTGAITLPKEGNNELNTFNVLARQTDIAGNVSSLSQMKTVVVDLRPIGLKSITTTKPSGVYKAGVLIPLTLEFYKAIKSNSDVTLTLSNDKPITFKPDGKSVYTVNYTTASGHDVDALFVKNFAGTIIDSATGVSVSSFEGVDCNEVSDGKVNGTITATNLPNTGNVITIDTKAPKLTDYTVNSLGGTPVITDSKNYLNAGDTVEIAAVFGEAVTISGDSTVTLNNNKKAVYTGTSDDKKTLYYTYTVAGGDDKTDLGIAANIYPNNIQDIAGNTLSAGLADATTLKHDSKNIDIDTVCVAPTLGGISAGKIYNDAQTVTLSGETGATFYYSVDGGANSQKGQSFSTPTTEGRHPITAYQVDIAGNKSLWANVIEIIVDTAPPAIKSISTTAGSGSYKKGDIFTIVAEFTENVTGNITVTLNTTAEVTFANITDSNAATATYTALSGHDTDRLEVSSVVSGSITDTAGNNVTTFNSDFANFDGKNIKIDTTAPEINGFSMTSYSGSETTGTLNTILQNRATDSKIILNFNEGVSKGSGSIKIERVYKSYPAVMEVDDYNTHKASISSWYIQRCIGTVNNNGTEPDTNAKYVLKYDIDHGAYASASDISNSTQKAVYNYFADKEYNVTTIDVNSGLVTIDNNTSNNETSKVTIQLPSKLQRGIIYKVTFTAGTFTDTVGNKCAAESGSKVRFETGPTATPVIRINKISGRGEDGNGEQPHTTNVKISSEMYGAKLYYGTSMKTHNTSGEKNTVPSDPSSYSYTTNKQQEITLNAGNINYAAIFKIFAYVTKTGLSGGDKTKELAFKTLITSTWQSCYVRGSDSSGGVSATTEFPSSWYESKETARLTYSHFVSWHILKSFQWKIIDTNKKWGNSDNIKTYPGSYGKYEGG